MNTPPELVLLIASFLDSESLLRAIRCSKRFGSLLSKERDLRVAKGLLIKCQHAKYSYDRHPTCDINSCNDVYFRTLKCIFCRLPSFHLCRVHFSQDTTHRERKTICGGSLCEKKLSAVASLAVTCVFASIALQTLKEVERKKSHKLL